MLTSHISKHRAKLTGITKAVALLGVMVIPALRDMFMTDDGGVCSCCKSRREETLITGKDEKQSKFTIMRYKGLLHKK